MSLIIYLSIILNLITLVSFAIGFVFALKEDYNPKHIARLGVVIGISTILHLISLAVVIIFGYLINQKVIWLLPFVIAPFIIGKLVTYDTIKRYSVLQILCFCGSLLVLFKLL